MAFPKTVVHTSDARQPLPRQTGLVADVWLELIWPLGVGHVIKWSCQSAKVVRPGGHLLCVVAQHTATIPLLRLVRTHLRPRGKNARPQAGCGVCAEQPEQSGVPPSQATQLAGQLPRSVTIFPPAKAHVIRSSQLAVHLRSLDPAT